jgi:hypothetical protein
MLWVKQVINVLVVDLHGGSLDFVDTLSILSYVREKACNELGQQPRICALLTMVEQRMGLSTACLAIRQDSSIYAPQALSEHRQAHLQKNISLR